MFLARRQNGIFYVYYTRNGKRTCISTKTKSKSEAIEYLSNFKNVLQEREKAKTIPISLHEFMFVFFRYSEAMHSPNTTALYKVTFKKLLEYFGDIKLSQLTHKELDVYFLDRIKKYSIYAARKDLINISSFFNYAIRKGYVNENPIRYFKRFKVPEKLPLFFSEDEFQLLLERIVEKDLKDIVVLAVQTGLRQMELLTLQWEQINFTNKNLLLDNRNYLTKSRKIRSIPLSKTALEILERRRPNKNYGTVFTIDGKIVEQDFLSRLFKRYVRKTPINPKLNFHSLRHTFASWLVQRGVSIYIVSKLLGHASIKTTQIYAHLRSDDMQNAVNILSLPDAVLGKKSSNI